MIFVLEYCAEFGATYTLSSSQMLHSLMGSCSIMEGLDSDATPTPSPQPSLGDTIRAAAQLEPGLTAKPPLPPTPTPTSLPREDSALSDDIIALKFQRWFPDAILESEIIQKTTLKVNPFEKQKDETDMSDGGTDSVDLSDRESDRTLPTTISTFVKKNRIPKKTNEELKKTTVKFSDKKVKIDNTSSDNNNKIHDGTRNNCKIHNKGVQDKKSSPTIVVQEPDLYGCDIVTEEFTSETNIHCLTPDYKTSLKNNCQYLNDKSLSLSDLNVNSDEKSYRTQVYSDSEVFQDKDHYVVSGESTRLQKVLSDSELFKDGELLRKDPLKPGLLRNEIASPEHFETSASNCRFTSTPIGIEDTKQSRSEVTQDNILNKLVNTTSERESLKSKNTELNCKEKVEERTEHFESLSPPVRLRSEEDEIYHDHLNSYMSYLEDNQSKNNASEAVLINEEKPIATKTGDKTLKPEKQTNVLDETNLYNQLLEARKKYGKNIERGLESFKSADKKLSKIKDQDDDSTLGKSKQGSFGNSSEEHGHKNRKSIKEVNRASSVPPFPDGKHSAQLSKQIHSKGGFQTQHSKRKVKRSMSYDAASIPVSEYDYFFILYCSQCLMFCKRNKCLITHLY